MPKDAYARSLVASSSVSASETLSATTAASNSSPVVEVEDARNMPDLAGTGSEETYPAVRRASFRLDVRAALDTRFDRADEHIAEFSWGGRLTLDVSITDRISMFVEPRFLHRIGFD